MLVEEGDEGVEGGRERDRRAILQQAHILETKKMLFSPPFFFFISCGHAENRTCVESIAMIPNQAHLHPRGSSAVAGVRVKIVE